MFIVVHHTITDPETAFARGENLLAGNGAPPGVRVREFYPSRDKADVVLPLGGQLARGGARLRRRHHGRLQPSRRTSRSTRRSLAGSQSWRRAGRRR